MSSSERALVALVLVVASCVPPAPSARRDPSPERGRAVFRRLCASCHGEQGDGRGRAAVGLVPPPRDFTQGVYRYRSTPTGALPTATDLARTIQAGVPGTAMPAWSRVLTSQEIADVVAHLQTLSSRFGRQAPEPPIEIPAATAASPASVARGRSLYVELQCGRCHGPEGAGDGAVPLHDLRDDAGHMARPADFRRGLYRSGPSRRDLHRTIRTGLDGTPMASFEGSISPEDTNHLVNYVVSLVERGVLRWLRGSPGWYEPSEEPVER